MNRFFLRCWPRVVGSLAIGQLRVQTGATSLCATLTLRSQKGTIAHRFRFESSSEDGKFHHIMLIVSGESVIFSTMLSMIWRFSSGVEFRPFPVEEGCFRDYFFGGNLAHFDGVNFGLEFGEFGGQGAVLVLKRFVYLSKAFGRDLVCLVKLVRLTHFGVNFFNLPVVRLK